MNTMKTVINKIYIDESGKNIMFKCVGSFSKQYYAPINTIQRPVKSSSLTELTNFGFPILIDNKLYILCKIADFKVNLIN